MSYAQRIDRELERRDSELWQEHERGGHPFQDGAPSEPDCARCQREMREALNVEGDPALNGAFTRW